MRAYAMAPPVARAEKGRRSGTFLAGLFCLASFLPLAAAFYAPSTVTGWQGGSLSFHRLGRPAAAPRSAPPQAFNAVDLNVSTQRVPRISAAAIPTTDGSEGRIMEEAIQHLAAATLAPVEHGEQAVAKAVEGEGIVAAVAAEGEGIVAAVKDAVTPLSVAKDGRVSLDGQKLLNLVVLLAGGGYMLTTLLTVDHNIWRGWTWQEVAMRIPYDSWNGYETGLEENPILVKTLINVVIYLIGDWMAQTQWGKDGRDLLDFDLGRTLRNGIIAALFGPLVHAYYEFSDVILPMDEPINRVLKILMDQSVYFATKCSAYIALVALLRGDGPAAAGQQVKDRLWPVLTTGWKFWPIVHVFTYSVIPPRHRVLWVNCVDLLWSSILSSTTNSNKEAAAPGGEGEAGTVDDSADVDAAAADAVLESSRMEAAADAKQLSRD